MAWYLGNRKVASPTGATVRATATPFGALLRIEVEFQTKECPAEETGLPSLLPQPSEVTLRTVGGAIDLGFAQPRPADLLPLYQRPSTGKVHYTLPLSQVALAAVETARNGGAISLIMELAAHAFRTDKQVEATSEMSDFAVPREEWHAALKNAGYCEVLLTELRLPAGGLPQLANGYTGLRSAVTARDNGSYADTLVKCRTALDALETAGFGGKAPRDVATFLKQNARRLTQEERYSALKLALQLYLSPAAHSSDVDPEFTREDAELAIAMTAALLRLAPNRWTEPQEPDK